MIMAYIFVNNMRALSKTRETLGETLGEFLNIPLISLPTFEKRNAHTTPAVFTFGHT